MQVLENVYMKDYTTYKIGGCVRIMYFPENTHEFVSLIKELDKDKTRYFIVGNGSNILFPDEYFDGAIINTRKLNGIKIENDMMICDAGAMLPRMASMAISNGYSGLEWAIGIPGTIGASVFNNAGAYGSDISTILESVLVMDKNYDVMELKPSDCLFGYRTSIFKTSREYIILSSKVRLSRKDRDEMDALIRDRMERRKSSQPLEFPSAGSVFRNPSCEKPAGKLIEDLGLKGYAIGGAKVSEKHANFIVNTGSATYDDVKKLIEYVREKVRKEYEIELVLEQEVVEL